MLLVEIHAISHIGHNQKINKDNFLLLNISNQKKVISSQEGNNLNVHTQKFEIGEEGIVLAVSDGIGDTITGENASQMAVEIVSSRLLDENSEYPNSSLIERLYDATVYANHAIHWTKNDICATFTAVGLTPFAVDYIQVGNSCCYLTRNVKIYKITKEQSLVQQLIDSGKIMADEADHHPLKNVILQELGAQNEVYPVPARLIPQRDDILLLCSDGLSNNIPPEDILRIILDNSESLNNACKILVDEANNRGVKDNITVILAKLTGSDLLEPNDEPVLVHPLTFGDIHDTAD